MRCVIAGGGTGGHFFPGLAIAQALVEKETKNEVLFVGTEKGIEARGLAGSRFALKTIQVKPLKGRSVMGKLKATGILPRAVWEALSILKDFEPQVVLGVGGYASGPTLVAAFLLGKKRAIHEQNLVPGMTNRLLKRLSHRVFVSFEESKKYFPTKKTAVTGTPVRKEFLAYREARQQSRKEREKDSFTLLVLGGSAGAHRINQAMIEALSVLRKTKLPLRFIHQTGREDLEWVSRAYKQKGLDARVEPFFDDMVSVYEASDLVLCRAGASTIAELTICGKAAVLVPYPYAADQHQLLNAQKLVELGAARMIRDDELSGPSVARAILEVYERPEERFRMEEAIGRMGRPRAAQDIVNHLYALVGTE